MYAMQAGIDCNNVCSQGMQAIYCNISPPASLQSETDVQHDFRVKSLFAVLNPTLVQHADGAAVQVSSQAQEGSSLMKDFNPDTKA